MDKALKQRLVGASVLVALAVVVLPMLLGGQPDSQQDAPRIELPPRPQELEKIETRRFPVGQQPPGQSSMLPDQSGPEQETELRIAPPKERPATNAQIAAAEGAAELPLQTSTAQAANAEMPVDGAPADRVTAQPIPDAATVVAGASEDVVSSEPPKEEPAASNSETPVPVQVPPVSASGGRYLVQVAMFSGVANANRLAGRLRESGMPVVMDTVERPAGTLHRVRVGAFDNRDQAEQVLTRLNRELPDLKPRLVDLQPEAPTPVAKPSDPLIRWVVQVGSFGEAANAEKLVFKLRDAGYRATSVAVTNSGTTSYKVRVGPEAERAAAGRLKDRLSAEMGISGLVMSTD